MNFAYSNASIYVGVLVHLYTQTHKNIIIIKLITLKEFEKFT